MENPVELNRYKINIEEPLARALKGSEDEIHFSLSLLDVARMSGHCCMAVAGAFFMTKAAIEGLFANDVCIRGDVLVELPTVTTPSATGPVANVISYITGAWGPTGFGGLSGKHVRKDLLKLDSAAVPPHTVRFTRISTGKSVLVKFQPEAAAAGIDPAADFPDRIKAMVRYLLDHSDQMVKVQPLT
jgi:hypothetical protein